MPAPPTRYTITLDRLDGGEPVEEMDVHDVQLRSGAVTIIDGKTRLFSGEAWSWLEVRRSMMGRRSTCCRW